MAGLSHPAHALYARARFLAQLVTCHVISAPSSNEIDILFAVFSSISRRYTDRNTVISKVESNQYKSAGLVRLSYDNVTCVLRRQILGDCRTKGVN